MKNKLFLMVLNAIMVATVGLQADKGGAIAGGFLGGALLGGLVGNAIGKSNNNRRETVVVERQQPVYVQEAGPTVQEQQYMQRLERENRQLKSRLRRSGRSQ